MGRPAGERRIYWQQSVAANKKAGKTLVLAGFKLYSDPGDDAGLVQDQKRVRMPTANSVWFLKPLAEPTR